MFCNSIVKHCHDWIDSFIPTEAAEDLQQCGTLAGVIKSLPLLKLASDLRSSTANQTPAALSRILLPLPLPSVASPARTLRKRH